MAARQPPAVLKEHAVATEHCLVEMERRNKEPAKPLTFWQSWLCALQLVLIGAAPLALGLSTLILVAFIGIPGTIAAFIIALFT